MTESSNERAWRSGVVVPGAARNQGAGLYRSIGKRVCDVVLAFVMLSSTAPLMLAILLAVSLDGHPPIYRHTRLGRKGRTIRIFKFRTMRPGSDALLAELLARDEDAAREWAETHKLVNDPRVTPIGRFLRRTSLDELPQLLNVISGDMSLVGPRPVTAAEIDHYGPVLVEVQTVRPGLTGAWQVEARGIDSTYETRVKLDAAYVRSVTFINDLLILLRTTRAVLHRTGT